MRITKGRMTTRAVILGLALLPLVLPAASYGAPPAQPPGAQAWFYETAERVTFTVEHGIVSRDAVSPLTGFAPVGTPLCPSEMLANVPGVSGCTVIALGKDAVDTATLTGPVSGTFYVVIDIPSNPSVHVPDLPVISGKFHGQIGPVVPGLPLLSINGSFRIQHVDRDVLPKYLVGTRANFTGTFRIPIGDHDLNPSVPAGATDNAYYMYLGPVPHGCVDLGGGLSVCPVQPSERAIGFPTVRLEIQFTP